jgi:molybdopterin-guanine dinucleotide biosynthesis protein A
MHTFSRPIVAGIFVGGASRRMGGSPKGLLRTSASSDETLVGRWRALFERVGIPAVLVGDRSEYAALGLTMLRDARVGVGPIGGLVALLAHAGDGHAIAVACDMPAVSESLVLRLARAPEAAAVAPRRDDRWEPFFARYDAPLALPVARARADAGADRADAASASARSLQRLLDALAAVELPVTGDEARELRDWDTPEDVRSG